MNLTPQDGNCSGSIENVSGSVSFLIGLLYGLAPVQNREQRLKLDRVQHLCAIPDGGAGEPPIFQMLVGHHNTCPVPIK